MRLTTPPRRTGFALSIASAAVLLLGLLAAEVDTAARFWRFVWAEWRGYEDWAVLVFVGFWGLLFGLFLWTAYDITLRPVLAWIRYGKAPGR